MTIFCTNCGNKTLIENKFCSACGASSSSITTQKVPEESSTPVFKLDIEAAKQNAKESIGLGVWLFKWALMPGVIFLLVYGFFIQ
jgi:uncharacterized membrane protein YvbJ